MIFPIEGKRQQLKTEIKWFVTFSQNISHSDIILHKVYQLHSINLNNAIKSTTHFVCCYSLDSMQSQYD